MIRQKARSDKVVIPAKETLFSVHNILSGIVGTYLYLFQNQRVKPAPIKIYLQAVADNISANHETIPIVCAVEGLPGAQLMALSHVDGWCAKPRAAVLGSPGMQLQTAPGTKAVAEQAMKKADKT
jgi:hypothetical protein